MSSVTTTDPTTADVTTTTLPPTTTIPPTSTTTLPPSTSTISVDPSTTTVAPPTTLVPTTIITQVTSVVTQAPADTNTQGPIITTITSTQPVVTFTPSVSEPSSTSETSSSASASRSALNPAGQSSGTTSGLSSGATIAIAVIIPIVAVVAGVLFGLWFWRRRKAKKNAEEMRKIDNADYTFNPNHDPTLPVGAVAYTDGGSEGNDDSGYRGWGATTMSNRKTSTALDSNGRAAASGGQGMSDAGSQPGGYNMQPSPSAGGASEDPLVHGYDGAVGGVAGVGAGAGAAAMAAGASRNRHSQSQTSGGIRRGVSNASSAYSAGAPGSDISDAPEMPRPYYQEEVPYNVYNDPQQNNGPYMEDPYNNGGEEPVIRDVQARRNTKIERAPTFPQQGGIAQNF